MIPLKKLLEIAMVNELIVHGDRKTAQYLLAYKEHVWLFRTEGIDEEDTVEISKVTGIDLSDVNDFYELTDAVDDNNDVVLAQIDPKKRSMYIMGFTMLDPKTSITLKKIAKELKLNRIERSDMGNEDGGERVTKKSKIQGKMPKIVYHGTSSEYLRDILKLGLKPGEKGTNYPAVIKQDPEFLDKTGDNVYFTSKFDEAKMHAIHTTEKLKAGDPVIIQMRIPDENLIQTDYDVGKEFEKQGARKMRSMTRETGVLGYQGRVPPSYIDYVFAAVGKGMDGPEGYYNLSDKDYRKMNKQRALSYLDRLDMYGY